MGASLVSSQVNASLSSDLAKLRPRSFLGRWDSWWFPPFVTVTLAGVVFAASSMRLAFPALTVLLGVVLFARSKPNYVSLLCWVWFLSPLMRRVIDYRSGTDATIVLLTPYAVAFVPALSILYDWPQIWNRRAWPLLVMLLAVVYGTIIGLTNFSVASVLQIVVIWLSPLTFALFLVRYRADAAAYFASFERSMIAGTAFAGVYGIYQYFTMPAWDALWMKTLGNTTFGFPTPMQVRVFSVLNAPQILALFVSVGILLAVRSRGWLRFVAVPSGILVLVLSMARTAWVSLSIGLLYTVWRLPPKQRLQILAIGFSCCIALGVVLQDPDVNFAVTQRVNTLSNVGGDDSIVTRVQGHLALLENMTRFPFGLGLGGQQTGSDKGPYDAMLGHGGKYVMQNDSTLAAFLISLGLFGTLLAMVSFAAITLRVITFSGAGRQIATPLKAIYIVIATEFLLDNIINGPGAFVTWSCVGFSFALWGGFGSEARLAVNGAPTTSAMPPIAEKSIA